MLTVPTIDGATFPKLIGRWCPLSISPGNRLELIVKPSVSLSVNDQDEDQDDNTAVVVFIATIGRLWFGSRSTALPSYCYAY